MSKGTPSFGKRNKKLHVVCRRCGHKSYHVSKRVCAKCGFGKSKRIRSFSWLWKPVIGKRNRKI